MMRKYVPRPHTWLDPAFADNSVDPSPALPSIQIFEREGRPEKTGLFDHLGNELYAVDEPKRIGFIAWKAVIR